MNITVVLLLFSGLCILSWITCWLSKWMNQRPCPMQHVPIHAPSWLTFDHIFLLIAGRNTPSPMSVVFFGHCSQGSQSIPVGQYVTSGTDPGQWRHSRSLVDSFCDILRVKRLLHSCEVTMACGMRCDMLLDMLWLIYCSSKIDRNSKSQETKQFFRIAKTFDIFYTNCEILKWSEMHVVLGRVCPVVSRGPPDSVRLSQSSDVDAGGYGLLYGGKGEGADRHRHILVILGVGKLQNLQPNNKGRNHIISHETKMMRSIVGGQFCFPNLSCTVAGCRVLGNNSCWTVQVFKHVETRDESSSCESLHFRGSGKLKEGHPFAEGHLGDSDIICFTGMCQHALCDWDKRWTVTVWGATCIWMGASKMFTPLFRGEGHQRLVYKMSCM